MQQVGKFDKHTKFSYLIVTLLYIFLGLFHQDDFCKNEEKRKQVMKRI